MADDIEHQKIMKFAADAENREYIKIAIKIKESGIPADDIIISRKI